MKALVTGAAGHLGEALVRLLSSRGHEAIGLDRLTSPFVRFAGDICDPDVVRRAMEGAEVVFHAATLHKPHIVSHSRQAFIDANVSGTRTLLEAAVQADVRAFVFTSTTSVFGDAMTPDEGAPAVWVDETLQPRPRNIYGVSKLAAEGLCAISRREDALATVTLRTARFFPEEDDDPAVAATYAPDNLKLNEFLYRRADIEDVAEAHLLAAARAGECGPGPFILSGTTPLSRQDLADVADDAPGALARAVPEYEAVYHELGWRMFPTLGRIYDNAAARRQLGWRPRHDFRSMLRRVANGSPPASELALAIGAKGYHRDQGVPP